MKKIDKATSKEILFYVVLLGLSCLNSGLIYIYLVVVLFKIREGYPGFLKICLLYTLRQGIFIPGVATMTGGQSTLKLYIMAGTAILIILNYLKNNGVPRIYMSVLLFGALAAISAVFFGSYPIAGLLKVINFTLIMFGIVIAVSECIDVFDIETYIYYWLTVVMIFSFCLIPISGAYLTGSAGLLFRGIWNHPNDFGVICSIYLCFTLVNSESINFRKIAQIILVFIMIFLSHSRGAMIASIGTIIIYIFTCQRNSDRKVLGEMIVIGALLILFTPLRNEFFTFFSKSGSETTSLVTNAFSSRDSVIDIAMMRFKSNPLFGRGLLITYEPGLTNYALSNDGYEPGNIFLELLAGTGGVGLLAFLFMMLLFIRYSLGKRKLYVAVVLLASISEVSFFSVNNYASLYYFMLGLSMFAMENKMDCCEEYE